MKRALLLAAVVLIASSQAVPSTLEQTIGKTVRIMALHDKIINEFADMTGELVNLRSSRVNAIVGPHLDKAKALAHEIRIIAEEK